MSRPSSSLQWLTLAVLLPLLVLGVLAWLGVRAQVKAAWSSAREEAKVAGKFAGETMTRELEGAMKTTPLFPDPPLPGLASEADAVLDGNDLTELRKLRDDPQAGISPAGLPRRVLAGFRVFEASKDPADAKVLVNLATGDAASVLTPLVFAKTGEPPQNWAEGDRVRAILRQHPEIGSAGKWIADGDETWWLASDGKTLRFIPPAAFMQAVGSAGKQLPPWANLLLSIDGRMAAGSRTDLEVMESIPVRFGEDLRMEIVAARPDMIERNARQQGRWTLGLLGLAVLVSSGALAMMHHAIRRERLLSEMKSQFVASVSHELRAPVASIRLMADALEAEKVGLKTAKDFHRLIARESARLSTLVGNVLDHARIEQGRKVWKLEPCDLSSITADTLRVMEPLASEKGIKLLSQLAPVEAAVDAGAIQQALVNLLDNAIKFSPSGTTVETSLSIDAATWKLSVRDQGPGIPKEERQRIFERFYRPGDELRRETQGTGIGLSLVKAIAEVHGGKVVLDSDLGQGSVFTLMGPVFNSLHP
jgi:two-component system phosphate regulon sensor histidine kinase PhoR